MVSQKKISLSVEKRNTTGKKVKNIRQANKIPAVLYGEKAHEVLSIDKIAFNKIYSQVGETGLIEVNLGDKIIPCIIRHVQTSPIKNEIIHTDLYAVNLTEKVEADIPLAFVGQAPVVVDEDGTLIEVKSELHVEALPADLVPEIEVNIESLKTFDDTLHVKDIIVPAGITVLDDLEETIATVEPPRSEEELAALDEAVKSDQEIVAEVESETKEGTSEAPAEEDASKKPEGKTE